MSAGGWFVVRFVDGRFLELFWHGTPMSTIERAQACRFRTIGEASAMVRRLKGLKVKAEAVAL